MALAHNPGFPRIGIQRELKFALEACWQGKLSTDELNTTAATLRERHWNIQAEAGLDLIPVGDFSLYDQVLDHSAMFGVVPPRFNWRGDEVDINTYFTMARGRAPDGQTASACEMTKWFDTNYHYIVPEFQVNQTFRLTGRKLFDEIMQAQQLGHPVKPVIIGPLSYLWLGKCRHAQFDKLDLLDSLIAVYRELVTQLKQLNIEWIQIDEPILTLDLPQAWQQAFRSAYGKLHAKDMRYLLTTYFGALGDNLELVCDLPVSGVHIDICSAPDQLDSVIKRLPQSKIISAGIINGREIWRNDLQQSLEKLIDAQKKRELPLWLAPSCSLLHVPVDLSGEQKFDSELKSWFCFATQKLSEIKILKTGLEQGSHSIADLLEESDEIIRQRKNSAGTYNQQVRQRVSSITDAMTKRNSPYKVRAKKQADWLKLPDYPTTTIGSFPQTATIRRARREFKQGKLSQGQYQQVIQDEIKNCIQKQEQYGLDVLVHGEPERNDMVEYFGEQLNGFAFSENGWVQSYGSRCVKPPIIYGDVSREKPMTVEWTRYAQSITGKPVKGMLTGPVTILNWSFVRDDQPREDTCMQIALALRDEVCDLENADVKIIQIDEAALREGLPLRHSEWRHYLDWAVRAFCIASSEVADDTQIHTHMCYSEFNDIIESIAAMDADVITIETSRSNMELLDVFEDFEYPNQIGPGVYDIHSPNVPQVEHMVELMKKAAQRIPANRLWINPDCGLKTRGWEEVDHAMVNMVRAAQVLRQTT